VLSCHRIRRSGRGELTLLCIISLPLYFTIFSDLNPYHVFVYGQGAWFGE